MRRTSRHRRQIMAAAAAEKVPIDVITERYTRFYFDDLGALGVPRRTWCRSRRAIFRR